MPTYYIRAEVLNGFSQECRSLGIDDNAILRHHGLSPSLLGDLDLLLPYEAVTGVMEEASELSRRADFSRRLTNYQRPIPIGLPRVLMHQASSVRAALQTLVDYNHLHSQGIVWHIEESEQNAYLIREDKMAGKLPSFQYAQLSITHAIIAMRSFLKQPHWLPLKVLYSYAEPRHPQVPRRLFGTRIQYNQERTAIAFARKHLDRPLSPQFARAGNLLQLQIEQLGHYQRQRYPASKPEALIRLEYWIRRHIHQENCQLSELAQQLSLHPKKLQRQLAGLGLNFRRLKADIRLDMAEHYLRDSDLPLTTIAALVGFGDLSGFSRAFKHRHQHSPLAWRESHQP